MEKSNGCTGSLEEYQVVPEECQCTLEDWKFVMGCTGECQGTLEHGKRKIGCTGRFEVYHEVHWKDWEGAKMSLALQNAGRKPR